MSKRNLMVSLWLTSLCLSARAEGWGERLLKEEFNICLRWHDGMTWEEFLSIRNGLQRDGLVRCVDKIKQQELAKEIGIEVPKTYIATREKVPLTEILSTLPCYVAKMTHLSFSQGLIIVKDGINMVTGEPITPEQVQETLFDTLGKKPREVESWALHQVEPGFMIQEYIPNRLEVKIQTVWGKAVVGEWRGGEPKTPTTGVWGRYDRDGNLMWGTQEAPEWWPHAIAQAELIAEGTDALRVDFLVKGEGELLLNELEIWPESDWSCAIPMLEKKLNDGYRSLMHARKTDVERS